MIFLYLKNNKSCWVFSAFCMLLFCATCYFLFLQSTVARYKIAQKNKMGQMILLKQKETLAKSDVQTTKELNAWQQKHPHFYAAIQLSASPDQLLQLLTHTAQQAGFSIVQAEQIPSKKKSKRFIQLQLSGHYKNLFYFINKINHAAWPITFVGLKISHEGIFNCKLKI